MTITQINIPGYQISEELYNGSRTLVYRAIRDSDRKSVVIKLLKNPYPSFNELVQFRNQYTISKNLNAPEIIQTHSIEAYQNGYALVMEDFGGISLQKWTLKQGIGLSLNNFLPVAISLCNILDILYRHRIIHKDIKPANILINPETKQIKLIDFSIASLLPRETQTLISANVLEGTLAYISPEQTGRMNRGIDYRTDFYSLGVTFYELLTGKLPFQSNDPLELLHCHIAKKAEEIESEQIPQILSDIVMKLMAKNAEDRYQSALGLKFDLENCLAQLQGTGEIKDFSIAQRDVCDRFMIPEKLYGRENEVKTLLKAFECVSNNQTQLMLIAGFSGIGKTAVVNEIYKPIVRQRAYFIKGKFDQFNRNIPFSAFVQAFRDLMRQLLTESDAQLSNWKNKILQVLGDNGQVILEVIPELERIIGEQSPAIELPPSAAQNRFNLLFQKFIQVFSTKEHPLVIFVDDLQWADSASLKLINLLMNQSESGYLLLIGAYRDREVSTSHPLMLTLADIHKTYDNIHTITLAPLSKGSVNILVSDTLNCSNEIARPLTELIYQKTLGNPFFVTQFLKALYEDKLITFNFAQRYWQCDIAAVKALALTDDVVEFVALQLQKLPTATQNVLKLAACIGHSFDLLTLAIVSQQSAAETAASLWKALEEGLIIATNEVYKFYQQKSFVNHHFSLVDDGEQMTVTYKFLHDRVQQAAYSLIPDSYKQFTHLKIGQLLLENTPQIQQDERIFEIVSQLNWGISLITEPNERQELAQLNLNAGRKAKEATAYGAAVHYLNSGIQLLAINSWKLAYKLTLNLYEEAAEAAFLNNEFQQMDSLIEVVLEETTTFLDRIKVYEVKLQADQVQGQPLQAIATGCELLAQLGVILPKSVTPRDIQQYVVNTLSTLADRSIHSLVDLPLMDDPKALLALRIMASIAPAIHQTSSYLLPIVACEEVNLSLKYGNAPLSAPGYADFGIVLNACNQLELGYEFGKLALMLVDKFQAKSVQSMTIFKVAALNQFNKQHVRDSIKLLQESHTIGLETGDFFHVLASMIFQLFYVYLSGREILEILLADIKNYESNFAKNQRLLNWSTILCQSINNLTKYSVRPECLTGENCQEEQLLLPLIEVNDQLTLHILFLSKLTLSYLFENFIVAVENANQGEQYLDGAAGMLSVPTFYYYDSLSRLAVYPTAELSQQDKLLLKVSENQKKLQFLAQFAPMNFQHKYDLVEAERHRILGEKMSAMELYDRAIFLAKENEYIQEAALSNELAAKFYLDWGKEKIAQVYMQEAYYCYGRWGAQAKTDDLEKRYPQLLTPILQGQHYRIQQSSNIDKSSFSHQTIQTNISSNNICEVLDFATIFKALQALSSEIKLEQLFATLLQVVMENAGAKKAALLIIQQEKLILEAIATIHQGVKLVSLPLASSDTIPIALVNYVKHSLETVILDDATVANDFSFDEYFIQEQPKSVLCTPIFHQDKLIGLLYLENQLTIGAFTSDHQQILNLLCHQAAISLTNAHLYASEQEKSRLIAQKEEQYRSIFEAVSDGLSISDFETGAIVAANTTLWQMHGCSSYDEFLTLTSADLIHPDSLHLFANHLEVLKSDRQFFCQGVSLRRDGTFFDFEVKATKCMYNGKPHALAVIRDISDRKQAEAAILEKSQELEVTLQELKQAQLQMVQNEKMATLGNLVAGVAHEINNPVGFLKGSLNNAEEYIQDLLAHIQCYQKHHPTTVSAVIEHEEDIDLEFLAEDLPKLIDSMKVASERIKDISTSLRTFSRADTCEKVACNLHEGIESTLLILKYRLKANEKRPAIEVITEYGKLPPVKCFLGQLNQVFMNILANAIDALDSYSEKLSFAKIPKNHQQILIATEVSSDQSTVIIRIKDNGQGIPEEIKARIFDHLFTTKEVGKGTGLGLAIARQIIEKTHGGRLSCNSVLGQGSEFIIELPVS